MRSHEGSPHNRWALACPAAGLISALMLVLIGFRYKGFPPPSEIVVIAAGFVLSLVALVPAVIHRTGLWLPRIVGATLGFLCLLGWFLVLLGGYM